MTRMEKPKVSEKVIYPELSYTLNGLLFSIHNSIGRYGREKQYGDALERLLNDQNISFSREEALPIKEIDDGFTNKADFVINNQLLVELKATPIVTREDYAQVHRYLQASGLKLGLLVNFCNKYLKPIRIIRFNS